MKYIYLLTFPTGTRYIGKSTIPIDLKQETYKRLGRSSCTSRKVINAIRKYGWRTVEFDILERNDSWTYEQHNQKERDYIAQYGTHESGYNMTVGGDGLDSKTARHYTKRYHATLSESDRTRRSKNCSEGQKKRYAKSGDSQETREKKRKAHQGLYLIEAPDGRKWKTYVGLKEFACTHEIGISYWQLFNAYRKGYEKHKTSRVRKDNNNWRVTRIK